MSNHPYDESEIIQEIIEMIKTSKPHPQIAEDLLARGIPEPSVDAMIKTAINELFHRAEIVRTLKNKSKSPLQIRQELLAKGIPESRVDAIIQAAVDEPNPEGIKFVRRPVKKKRVAKKAGDAELEFRNVMAYLLLALFIGFNLLCGLLYIEPSPCAQSAYSIFLVIMLEAISLLTIAVLAPSINKQKLSFEMKIFLGIICLLIIPTLTFCFFLINICMPN